MTPKQIAGLGRQLGIVLALFSDCFHSVKGRALLAIYVKGLISDLHRKTAEAIGCIDESGIGKSGSETVGVARQYNGNRTKPQIALDLIDRALANGIQVQGWTFDELYGRDGAFLDGLEARAGRGRGECSARASRKPMPLRPHRLRPAAKRKWRCPIKDGAEKVGVGE